MRPIRLANTLEMVTQFAADPDDLPEQRLKKTMLVLSSLMMSSFGLLWGSTYYLLNEPVAAIIPWFYSLLSLVSLAAFALTRGYAVFRFGQLLLPLLLPFLLTVALGGFVDSSAVLLWSLTSPLGAMLFHNRRSSMRWFAAFLLLLIVAALLQPFVRPSNNLPETAIEAFFVMNIGGTSAVAFLLTTYFVAQKDQAREELAQEQAKSERLLLNVLPASVAARLKAGEQTIADQYEQVSILFADLVGFTPMSAEMAPAETVTLLNELFSYFDRLTDKYGLEKIKTIGDCYMVAAGVPEARADHATALTAMALEAQRHFGQRAYCGRQVAFRFGINSGPVVGGVIGRKKFIFDLYGDMVNTASRMESHGQSGVIQVTQATYELIRHHFDCVSCGTIDVKGKGPMEVWHVKGVRS